MHLRSQDKDYINLGELKEIQQSWVVECQVSCAQKTENYLSYKIICACHPTISSSVVCFSTCLQSFPASVFPNESTHPIRWSKYWSFSFNSPSKKYSRLISFRIDWFALFAVQGTLKSLLQHHSSKASILWLSAFFIVQLLYPYMTIGKTVALTRLTFVSKVMFLLFNMLSLSQIFFQGASVF